MNDREALSDLGPIALDGFEVWDRTVQAPAGQGRKVAYVSVRVGGVIGMNRAAREMIGSPDAVKVMYDPKHQRIGLMPTVPEDKNSYDFAFDNTGLSCKKLFEFYGVEITESRRYYDLRVVDGVLVVELGGESEECAKVGRRRSQWGAHRP